MSSPKRPPAFQFYADAWIGSLSVETMPPAVEGTYIRLLARQWKAHIAGEVLPKEPATLRLLTKLSPAEWRKAWPQLEKHFPIAGDGRANSTLAAVWQERLDFIESQRENGKKGGRPEKPKPSQRVNPTETQAFHLAIPNGNPTGNPNETSVVCSLSTEKLSAVNTADSIASDPLALSQKMRDAILLTTAANAGLGVAFPGRKPFVGAAPRAQQMAHDLRDAGVDIEWAAATIFHHARVLRREEAPSSIAWFERFVHERWQQHLAKQDAAGYKPSHDGAQIGASGASSEVDQLHAFAIQYAREGKPEWIEYCDDRGIAWRAA